ncbi:short-chain dehydrogenase/reductase SDR [Pseudoxanthomonas spadix BD-a59]|uniref:Short-chain dehydrogenase/reductase SDR n=1 Tax=Pseudoxanthomonas spadix (strain BD-a59) TaxID=1045855 RepID=G7UU00_PSEUP|nr:3-oxoacyl-ACP reductase family protein [Pseudoxanthomonas spadix]AER57434.1 short-chain dehydrogenase/reductase SDR [Pseudoxanthomonas spadix BD-a59]
MSCERLKEHVALVTGGGRGIGKAIAQRLYQEGANVVICGTSEDVLRQAAEEIATEDRQVMPIVCDVSNASQIKEMVGKARERFGKVDILVNNAGIMLRHIGLERAARPFYELDEADWDKVMSVNVKGMWMCAREVFPDMRSQNWGRIINISSDTVYMGRGNGLQYVTSKAAVVGLTRALAFEVGRFGVTVNAISPGLTQSETVQEHDFKQMSEELAKVSAIPRLEHPQDLAGTAAWLASEDASFVTGQTISVSGGLSLH